MSPPFVTKIKIYIIEQLILEVCIRRLDVLVRKCSLVIVVVLSHKFLVHVYSS